MQFQVRRAFSASKLPRFILSVCLTILQFSTIAGTSNPQHSDQSKLNDAINDHSFIENKGQMVDMNGKATPFVLFKVSSEGFDLFITTQGLSYVFSEINRQSQTANSTSPEESQYDELIHWARVDIELLGAVILKENIRTEDPTSSKRHFFSNNHAAPINDVKGYATITLLNIYEGIDWVFHPAGSDGYKYDFIVHPGADPHQIQLLYKSAQGLEIDDRGKIKIATGLGTLVEDAPVCYLQGNDDKIPASFVKTGFKVDSTETIVSFSLENYDAGATLIIDPQLTWCTFYGGTGNDDVYSIDFDMNSNLFITGSSLSIDFPVADAGTFFQGTNAGNRDVIVAKFSSTGALLWATYYGGLDKEEGASIATDPSGNIFITGYTLSTDFPTFSNGTYLQAVNNGDQDAFLLKFSSNGSLVWASYYGGIKDEFGNAIATDAAGNVFVAGITKSSDFPVEDAGGGAFFQGTDNGEDDMFILKFDNSGDRLWATYYGGSVIGTGLGEDEARAICIDPSGNLFVVGNTTSNDFPILDDFVAFFQPARSDKQDGVIMKFNNAGVRLWATFYGGDGDDFPYSVAVDANENLFVTGYTKSTDFPVQDAATYYQPNISGSFDAFMLKFDNTGSRLWATYYGGTGNEQFSTADNLAIDTCGNVYVSYNTTSIDIPVFDAGCGGYFNGAKGGGGDILITRFTNSGVVTWATYLGDDEDDSGAPLAILPLDGKTLLASGQFNGYVSGINLPVIDPGGGAYFDDTPNGDGELFIARFSPIPISLTTSNSSICACLDTATVDALCGVAPFTYLWSDGQITQTAIGLCEGTYTVTVTDSDCSVDSATVVIVGCPMPVELVKFEAHYSEEQVQLHWITASEWNNDYFTIEKTIDGVQFEFIAEINALGNSGVIQEYFAADHHPVAGISYYRLKQTDYDGTVSFSEVVAVVVPAASLLVTAFENEATESLAIYFQGPVTDELQLRCMDISGRICYSAVLTAGVSYFELPLPNHAAGIYYLYITGAGMVSVTKLLIQ